MASPASSTVRTGVSPFRTNRRLAEWRAMFRPEHLGRDAANAVRSASVFLPTALAVALASGVPVATGLTTMVIGGAVAALVGSTPFVVVGPVVFLALLVASAHESFGMPGIVTIAIGAGLLQFFFGLFKLSHWLRAVPAPVVAGFSAGVGATVVVAQAPHLLGLPAPDSKHLIDVVTHAVEYLEHVRPQEALVASLTIAAALGVPRWMPAWPGRFFALLLGAAAAQVMRLDVETLHTVPTLVPSPGLVGFPRNNLFGFMGTTALLFVVASVQSLTSTDNVTRGLNVDRRDPNGDLVGMGVANVFCGLFGAIPVAVGQSLTQFHTARGVYSRRSTLLAALLVGVAALLAPNWIGWVPISAVAAVLVVVAAKLVDWSQFKDTWSTSRADGAVFALTFLLVLCVDLFAGAQVGVLAALGVVAARLGKLDVLLLAGTKRGPYRIRIDGPITFVSAERINALRSQLASLDCDRGVILDLSDVPMIDGSGAENFRKIVLDLRDKGWEVAVLGLRGDSRRQLESADTEGRLKETFATTEADAQGRFRARPEEGAYDRLRAGVETFRARGERFDALFDELAEGQKPHTLFITCADSRIQPSLITSTRPGELFLVRNVGNLVPPYVADDASPAEYAAIEYGIVALGVSQIVVCGHSSCGAMKAIIGGNIPPALDSVRRWIQSSYRPDELDMLRHTSTPEEAAQKNAALQLEHLAKHPLVAERLKAGTLRISAWFYDIGAGDILEYDRIDRVFRPLGSPPSGG